MTSSLNMPGGLPRTSGLVRVLPCGDIEVELYDRSESAVSTFGGEIATIHTIRRDQHASLAAHLSMPLPPGAPGRSQLVARLAAFPSFFELIDWLRSQHILTEKRVEYNV